MGEGRCWSRGSHSCAFLSGCGTDFLRCCGVGTPFWRKHTVRSGPARRGSAGPEGEEPTVQAPRAGDPLPPRTRNHGAGQRCGPHGNRREATPVALTVASSRLDHVHVVTEDAVLQLESRPDCRLLCQRCAGHPRLSPVPAPEQSKQNRQGQPDPASDRQVGAVHHRHYDNPQFLPA